MFVHFIGNAMHQYTVLLTEGILQCQSLINKHLTAYHKLYLSLNENLNLLSPELMAEGVSGGVGISGLFTGLFLGLSLTQDVRCL